MHLAGELDLYNAHVVRETLLACCAEEPRGSSSTSPTSAFVDSTALGVLIEARTRLADRQSFLLAAPGLETRRALEISGLDRHFSVHASVDEALASLSVAKDALLEPAQLARYADAIVKASLASEARRHDRRPRRARAPRAAGRRRRRPPTAAARTSVDVVYRGSARACGHGSLHGRDDALGA